MPRKILLLIPLILFQTLVFAQHLQRPQNALIRGARHRPALLGATDTCGVTTAERMYLNGNNIFASYLITTSDGGYLQIGYTNNSGAGGYDGLIIKTDNLGVIQWTKVYGGPTDDEFTIGKQTSDGGYILGGYTTSYGDPAGDAWLVKIDASGNLQWSKKYGDGNPNGDRLFNLIQTADGGYAFAGDHKYTPGLVDAMVVRVDANGNLLWTQGFDTGAGLSDESSGLAEDRDSLVVTAFYESGGGYDAVLMKLEETAGNIAWLQSWSFDGRTNRVGPIWVLPDGYLISGVNSDGFGVLNPWQNVLKTDFSGNLIWDQELHTTAPNQTMNGAMSPTADGGYVVTNMTYPMDANSDVYFTKVRNDGSIDWSWTYPQPNEQIPACITPTADGGFAGLSSTNWNGPAWAALLIKTDSTGQTTGCTNVAAAAYNRNPVVTNQAFTWPTIYPIAFNPGLAITPAVTTATVFDSTLCQKVNLCLDLQLIGPDSLCNIQVPAPYGSIRDSGCITPVQWSIDTAYATIVSQTDSTVQLQYKKTGAVTLYGQLNSTCGIVQDSLPIRIFHTTPVNLGNDTSFCAGISLMLNAGSGFQSYAWSTGDSTQQIADTTGGTYWVNALNPNSPCISTDTIVIVVYPRPVVNIGPNTSICRDSLYEFKAGIGFSSYLWQDGSTNSFFFAGQAGTYWVKVTDSNGCPGSDTARILSVQNNPGDFLQPTAEVCSKGQQPIQITAIGTWARYLWS
ncbi:MAG TPA: hypothetical protein VG101_17075, partial [Puia sp.]|nr:hypothetical protein [Puia sp.]